MRQLHCVVSHTLRHISKCEFCQGLGFICEICHDARVIYPFQLNAVAVCSGKQLNAAGKEGNVLFNDTLNTFYWLEREIAQWVHPMKDRSDDPSHHERTVLPRSYISLHAAGSSVLLYSGLCVVTVNIWV